jgi:phosphoribosylanthranilate isomerase
MTWVKICGITNLEDALTAVATGADALGFVFYEKSPRKVDVKTARKIAALLPAEVEKVGVFVDKAADQVAGIVRDAGLSAIQLHLGQSNLSACRLFARDGTKMFVVLPPDWFLNRPSELSKIISAFKSGPEHGPYDKFLDAMFLDSGSSQVPGGTGLRFDWMKAAPLASRISRSFKVVVAGGLTVTNVAEAMHILKPWGVDVASGVEAHPGKKDPDKVRAFISAVRDADRQS